MTPEELTRSDTLLLHLGEMTAQELRTAKAAVRFTLAQLAKTQRPTSAPDSSDADLLRKYIRHVVHCEGIDFLSGVYAREFFTPAELERLNALSDEAGQQEET